MVAGAPPDVHGRQLRDHLTGPRVGQYVTVRRRPRNPCGAAERTEYCHLRELALLGSFRVGSVVSAPGSGRGAGSQAWLGEVRSDWAGCLVARNRVVFQRDRRGVGGRGWCLPPTTPTLASPRADRRRRMRRARRSGGSARMRRCARLAAARVAMGFCAFRQACDSARQGRRELTGGAGATHEGNDAHGNVRQNIKALRALTATLVSSCEVGAVLLRMSDGRDQPAVARPWRPRDAACRRTRRTQDST